MLAGKALNPCWAFAAVDAWDVIAGEVTMTSESNPFVDISNVNREKCIRARVRSLFESRTCSRSKLIACKQSRCLCYTPVSLFAS